MAPGVDVKVIAALYSLQLSQETNFAKNLLVHSMIAH